MTEPKWMIDANPYSDVMKYRLFRKTVTYSFFGLKEETWRKWQSFRTREEAREYVESIRDLPEYL